MNEITVEFCPGVRFITANFPVYNADHQPQIHHVLH